MFPEIRLISLDIEESGALTGCHQDIGTPTDTIEAANHQPSRYPCTDQRCRHSHTGGGPK